MTGIEERHGQQGQGIVEAAVVLVALLSIWVAVGWLGRRQDMALHAEHAGRHAAFMVARDTPGDLESLVRTRYLAGPHAQWADRVRQPLLTADRANVVLQVSAAAALFAKAQPAAAQVDAMKLRKEWDLEDTGILRARLSIQSAPGDSTSGQWLNFSVLDESRPMIVRQTAILTNAGHASSDSEASARVAASATAWSGAANDSYRLARDIRAVMSDVDRSWGRVAPMNDWLQPWAGQVPSHHLGDEAR